MKRNKLSQTKLDNTVLSCELEIEGYNLVRLDRSRRGGGVASFVKNSVSFKQKANISQIFLPKSKLTLVGI